MHIGSIAYATDQGIGILAKAFYDHVVITDMLVVRHAHHPTHDEWYPNSSQTPIRPFNGGLARDFCSKMDAMLFIETPFDWGLIPHCRQRKIKTFMMPMYECYLRSIPPLCWADTYLCPSLLDYEYFKKHSSVYLPTPVSVPWRQRTKAEVFVHNAGHGGLRGRNGTKELLAALQYVKSPIRFILRTQEWSENKILVPDHIEFAWRNGTQPYETLWTEGDVFVFPDKFSGQSCPLEEARAAGMLVMGSDRFPHNTYLPTKVRLRLEDERMAGPEELVMGEEYRNPLIPVERTQRASVGGAYLEFDESIINPRAIAAKIDEWHGKDITEYSLSGKTFTQERSWEVLGPKWKEALSR